MKRLFVLLLALSLTFVQAFGQNQIKVKAPNLVGLNEQFNLTFEIQGEGKVDHFSWQTSDDFQLVWGPQEGTQSSTSIINGKVTRNVTKSYTYVLIPKKVGHFTLNPASVRVDGKTVNSDSPAIEVVAEQENHQGATTQNAEQTGNISDDDIFLRLQFSKTRMLVGEPITATLKLYQRVSIAGLEKGVFPDFDGFWSQEQVPANIEFQRESVNGAIYQSAVIRTWTLIPQQAGDHTITPSELICVVNVRVPRTSTGSIFDDFFRDDYRTVRKRVATSPIMLKVSPLPSGAPASFGGGVGSFNMEVKLSKDTLKTHEASSLIINLKGKGNISLLEAPKIKFPTDFELYDVRTSEIPGGKSFEYPFIPRSHGEFDIQPIEYSYYDTSAGKYNTLKSKELKLFVEKSSDAASGGMGGGNLVSGVQRKDVRDLASDIRFISTQMPKLKQTGAFFVLSPTFYILVITFVLIAAILYFVLKTLNRHKSDVVRSKNRAAVKMARKRLSQSEQFLKKGLYSAFYEELHKALLGYIGDKLNLDSADMSKDIISSTLIENAVSDNFVGEFITLLDECEFARYAPSSDNNAMKEHFEKAVSIISSIESGMKKNSKIKLPLALITLLLLTPNLFAQDFDAASLWTSGVEAYNEGDWTSAVEAWKGIENQGLSDSKLYYNIASAYFKNDEIAKAILYYERCLLVDPTDKDAQYNLSIASSMIQDKIDTLPEFFLAKWFRELSWSLGSNTWAGISLFFLVLVLGFVLLFLLGNSTVKRRICFSLGIVSLVLFAASLSLSIRGKRSFETSDTAIVMRAVCNVKSSPSSNASKDLFVIHEGTKVSLLDNLGAWTNIELSDGRQGWVLTSDIEVISPFER